jgi:hypothetical protein
MMQDYPNTSESQTQGAELSCRAFYEAAHDANLISDDHSAIVRGGVQCFPEHEGGNLIVAFLKEEQRVVAIQLHPDGMPRKARFCQLNGLRAFLEDIWGDSVRRAA